MIDIATENLILLKDAAKLLPNRPHLATLYRWSDGVDVSPKRKHKGHEKVRVQLETLVIVNERYTSKEAVQRFLEAYTAARDGQPGPKLVRGSTERRRDIHAAKQRLAKAGI